MLARAGQVEQHFGIGREGNVAVDQGAALRNVAQANAGRFVAEMDFAPPDERVAKGGPTLGTGRPAHCPCAGRLRRADKDGLRRRLAGIGEGAFEYVEQHCVTLGLVAADLGFMRKLQANPVAAEPTHRGFDRVAITEYEE